jgi:hypothetical protein
MNRYWEVVEWLIWMQNGSGPMQVSVFVLRSRDGMGWNRME